MAKVASGCRAKMMMMEVWRWKTDEERGSRARADGESDEFRTFLLLVIFKNSPSSPQPLRLVLSYYQARTVLTASLENFGCLPYTNFSPSTSGVHSDVLGQHISTIQHTHKTCMPAKAFKIHNLCFPVAFALALLEYSNRRQCLGISPTQLEGFGSNLPSRFPMPPCLVRKMSIASIFSGEVKPNNYYS
jgi:hypothetical protein